MKLYLFLLLGMFSSSVASAYSLSNCKEKSSGISVKYSFILNFFYYGHTDLVFKDDGVTYKGLGTSEEDYTTNPEFNNEITFHGSANGVADPSQQVSVSMLIYTSRTENGLAQVELYKPKQNTLLCVQNENP